MRTVSTNLKNHMAQETTTLATCWKIVRTDGKPFFFTDHDENLTFQLDTYTAPASYSRTSISSNSKFSIDNIDLKGFFASGSLIENEFKAGLFDLAEYELFIINYEDASMGRMFLSRGFIGRVLVGEDGAFEIELRGLMQGFSQLTGETFQPECRADLGDTKCGFPLIPNYITRDRAYSVGDWVRVQLNNLAATDYAVPLSNPDFESFTATDPDNWTILDGDVSSTSDTPYSGTLALTGEGTDQVNRIYQTVDLSTEPSFSGTSADNGYLALYGTYMRRTNDASLRPSRGRLWIEALDTNQAIIKQVFNSGYDSVKTLDELDVWTFKNVNHTVLPSGTRYLRFWIEQVCHDGSVCKEEFDDLLFRIIDTGGATSVANLFGNRIFECTTAGTTASATPAYSGTVGTNNTDGTAVFTTRDSFASDASVNVVTDNRTFSITISDAKAVDDWFNHGAIIWESGNNAGFVSEVKDWDRTGGDNVTLYIEAFYDIQSGDNFTIYAGCDKKNTTCINKFAIANSADFPAGEGNIINFRGEPYIPGRDHILRRASVS